LTFLGDGTWFGILIPLFLFIRYSYAISFATLGIIQLLLIQGLKRNVFGRLPRPAEYFKDIYNFQKVEGIDIHHFYSFPSGHTATAFGIATLMVILLRTSRPVTIGIFIGTTLVGLSRIYLAQHFLEDVLAGAVLGILSAVLVWWGYKKIEKRSPGLKIFNSSLRDIF
jgi:membrane-associated phospholipid phosphatase